MAAEAIVAAASTIAGYCDDEAEVEVAVGMRLRGSYDDDDGDDGDDEGRD